MVHIKLSLAIEPLFSFIFFPDILTLAAVCWFICLEVTVCKITCIIFNLSLSCNRPQTPALLISDFIQREVVDKNNKRWEGRKGRGLKSQNFGWRRLWRVTILKIFSFQEGGLNESSLQYYQRSLAGRWRMVCCTQLLVRTNKHGGIHSTYSHSSRRLLPHPLPLPIQVIHKISLVGLYP